MQMEDRQNVRKFGPTLKLFRKDWGKWDERRELRAQKARVESRDVECQFSNKWKIKTLF